MNLISVYCYQIEWTVLTTVTFLKFKNFVYSLSFLFFLLFQLKQFFASSNKLLIVCDPPFGVMVEPLMQSIEKLAKIFSSVWYVAIILFLKPRHFRIKLSRFNLFEIVHSSVSRRKTDNVSG